MRRQSELGANPFDALPIAIASLDFLTQETVLDLLERSSYDVIVVDEAHHCMDPGVQGEREDSQPSPASSTNSPQPLPVPWSSLQCP